MIYGIASYNRLALRTLKTLREAGIPISDVFVSVQTKKDLQAYREAHPEIADHIIYRKNDCAAGNRNTLLEMIDKRPICLLDDDITGFSVADDGKTFKKNTKAGLELIESLPEVMDKNGITVAGISATANSLILRNRTEYSVDTVLQGTVIIVNDNTTRFNEKYKMVEDYELSLRMIYRGDSLIRANYVAATKPKNGSNLGGLHNRYASGELKGWLKLLHKEYPIFRINKDFTGGHIRWG